MRIADYAERSARLEVIDPEAFWLDGQAQELYAMPVFCAVEPGETIATGYSGEYLTAPTAPGRYELWQHVLGGQHNSWEWRKEED